MKKLDEKRQLLVGALLLVVMLVFYVRTLLLPLCGKFRQVGQVAAQYRRELAVTEAGLKRMEQIKQEIAKLESQTSEAKRHFPAEREPLLEELSGIAETAGIKILETTPGQGAPWGGGGVKGLLALPITLSAMGGYHEFATFINALESSERVYLIQELSILANSENERVHSFQLVLKLFLQEGALP